MKFGVIVFPGSNCDHDCFYVIREVMGEECEFIWHEDRSLSSFDAVLLPGGFSYGDYLRPGSIARFSAVMEQVQEFAQRGGLVLGICNGFQVLTEAGLLPGVLMRNRSLKFICRTVFLRVERHQTPWTGQYTEGEVLEMPIAHGEGNFFIDSEGLSRLERNRQIVFRYCSPEGEVDDASNPNGSVGSVAGVCNEDGNVLGMMPHPERCSEAILGSEDGRPLFESALRWLRSR